MFMILLFTIVLYWDPKHVQHMLWLWIESTIVQHSLENTERLWSDCWRTVMWPLEYWNMTFGFCGRVKRIVYWRPCYTLYIGQALCHFCLRKKVWNVDTSVFFYWITTTTRMAFAILWKYVTQAGSKCVKKANYVYVQSIRETEERRIYCVRTPSFQLNTIWQSTLCIIALLFDYFIVLFSSSLLWRWYFKKVNPNAFLF